MSLYWLVPGLAKFKSDDNYLGCEQNLDERGLNRVNTDSTLYQSGAANRELRRSDEGKQ